MGCSSEAARRLLRQARHPLRCSAYAVLEATAEAEAQFGVEGIAPAHRWFGVEVEVGYLLDSSDITAFDRLRVDVVTGVVIYANGR